MLLSLHHLPVILIGTISAPTAWACCLIRSSGVGSLDGTSMSMSMSIVVDSKAGPKLSQQEV